MAEILSLLSANQAVDACRVAQDHGDHNAALLLAQLRSGSRVRHLARQQLAVWRDAEADQFIAQDRLKVRADGDLNSHVDVPTSAAITLNLLELQSCNL